MVEESKNRNRGEETQKGSIRFGIDGMLERSTFAASRTHLSYVEAHHNKEEQGFLKIKPIGWLMETKIISH